MRCYQIHPEDNVATMLENGNGRTQILGAQRGELQLAEPVALGHKVALRPIEAGEAVIKVGVGIGRATKPIARGAWVHLHNLASDLDERSATLDLHSGAPTDSESAYQ